MYGLNSIEYRDYVTKGRYIKFMESQDRRVRKDAFIALYGSYEKFRNTLASSLVGNIKKNKLYSTARNYNSSLESSLDSDNIKSLQLFHQLKERK